MHFHVLRRYPALFATLCQLEHEFLTNDPDIRMLNSGDDPEPPELDAMDYRSEYSMMNDANGFAAVRHRRLPFRSNFEEPQPSRREVRAARDALAAPETPGSHALYTRDL